MHNNEDWAKTVDLSETLVKARIPFEKMNHHAVEILLNGESLALFQKMRYLPKMQKAHEMDQQQP